MDMKVLFLKVIVMLMTTTFGLCAAFFKDSFTKPSSLPTVSAKPENSAGPSRESDLYPVGSLSCEDNFINIFWKDLQTDEIFAWFTEALVRDADCKDILRIRHVDLNNDGKN